MTAYRAGAPGRIGALAQTLAAVVLAIIAFAVPAIADDKAQLLALKENGLGRRILSFPQRLDLPAYQVHFENGVLAVEFEEAIDLALPDVAVALPDYVSVARVDPDRRGVRFGLRTG